MARAVRGEEQSEIKKLFSYFDDDSIDEKYLKRMFDRTEGLLLPGGKMIISYIIKLYNTLKNIFA